MTVALFLQLVQILNGLGGAGVAFVTIKKDIETRGLQGHENLPDEHLLTVKTALWPTLATGDTEWDENHAPDGG